MSIVRTLPRFLTALEELRKWLAWVHRSKRGCFTFGLSVMTTFIASYVFENARKSLKMFDFDDFY